MKSIWFNRHPDWVVALWVWGILFISVGLGILGIIPDTEVIDDKWFGIGGLVWIGGILFLCSRNLFIKKRSQAYLFWLLLQGLGVIIIMCLKDKRNNDMP